MRQKNRSHNQDIEQVVIEEQEKILIPEIEIESEVEPEVEPEAEVETARTIKITCSGRTNVRNKPSFEGDVLYTIGADDEITILEQIGEWSRIGENQFAKTEFLY